MKKYIRFFLYSGGFTALLVSASMPTIIGWFAMLLGGVVALIIASEL